MTNPQQRSSYPHPLLSQAGFTLVEIMVGLVIGMLATLVIMQVFSVFETQKRTTTGISDTMTNGNIALYKMERDIQDAGWGLVSTSDGVTNYAPLMCSKPITIDVAFPVNTVTDISPVSIIDGGGGLSDKITIRYGSSAEGGVPMPIQGMAGDVATIPSTMGCKVGSATLVMNANNCTISKATAMTDSGAPPLKGTITLSDPSNAVQDKSVLSCLGTWHEVTYSVDVANHRLQRQDYGAALTDAEPVVTDVVNIQAQYGVAAPGLLTTDVNFNTIVAWVDATGDFLTSAATPTVANRNRIKAVRIAVVTRDAKQDVGDVTEACNAATNTGLCAWADIPGSPAPTIDLTGIANWQKYRYRVFETIIPLRNVIFSKANLF